MDAYKCKKHGKKFTYFCYDEGCNTYICRLCFEEEHKRHLVSHMKEYLEKKLKEAKAKVSELDQFLVRDATMTGKVKKKYLAFSQTAEKCRTQVVTAVIREVQKRRAEWEDYSNSHVDSVSGKFNNFINKHEMNMKQVLMTREFMEKVQVTAAECRAGQAPYSKFIELYENKTRLERAELFLKLADQAYYSSIESYMDDKKDECLRKEKEVVDSIGWCSARSLLESTEERVRSLGKKMMSVKSALKADLAEVINAVAKYKEKYEQFDIAYRVRVNDREKLITEIKNRELENIALKTKVGNTRKEQEELQQQLKDLISSNKELITQKGEISTAVLISKQQEQISKLEECIKNFLPKSIAKSLETLDSVNEKLCTVGKDIASLNSTTCKTVEKLNNNSLILKYALDSEKKTEAETAKLAAETQSNSKTLGNIKAMVKIVNDTQLKHEQTLDTHLRYIKDTLEAGIIKKQYYQE